MALLKKILYVYYNGATLLQFHKHVHRINQFNISIFFLCSLEKKKKVPSMDLSNFFFSLIFIRYRFEFYCEKGPRKKIDYKKNDMKNEQRMLYNEFYILARDSIFCIRVHVWVYVWLWAFESFEFSILSEGRSRFYFWKKKANTKIVEKKIEGESDADADKMKLLMSLTFTLRRYINWKRVFLGGDFLHSIYFTLGLELAKNIDVCRVSSWLLFFSLCIIPCVGKKVFTFFFYIIWNTRT